MRDTGLFFPHHAASQPAYGNRISASEELSEYELIPEDWGGSTVFCPVSAHTKEGIENLLEMILLTAEVPIKYR